MKALWFVFSIFNYSVAVTGLLALIVFLVNYRFLDKAGRYIFYYTLISDVMVGLIFGTYFLWDVTWIWLSNVRLLIQYYPLAGFYYQVLKYQRIKNLIKISLIPMALIFIPDLLWWGGIHAYSIVFTTVRNVLLCGYGALYIFQLLSDETLLNNAVRVDSLPDFWYNAGLFIFLCTFLPAGFGLNYWQHSPQHTYLLISIVLATGNMQFLLFYVGVRKARKIQTTCQ